MIERLNGRTSVAIAVVGLLLVVLVGWFGFVSPQRSKAADSRCRDQRHGDAARGRRRRWSTARCCARARRELATLRTAIPDQVRMSQILRQLSKASADAQRAHHRDHARSPSTTVGVADVVAMNVTIEGRYFAIREFLRLLRIARGHQGGQGAGLGTALRDRLDRVHRRQQRGRRADPGDSHRGGVRLQPARRRARHDS